MKELSVEQKAQRYDEAIERAKKVLLDCTPEEQKVVEYISPELKERESEDERIRKWIYDIVNNLGEPSDEEAQEELEEMQPLALAWLEKQGESELSKDLGEYIAELSKQFPEVSFAKLSRIAVRVKNWLEKQGGQKPAETEKGVKRNDREIPFSEKEPYEGLTDFERTLADICIGWIGQELGWKQYIKDNADALLKIAIKKFNSVQDAIFEKKPAELSHSEVTKTSDQVHKPAEWSEEDSRILYNVKAYIGYAAGQRGVKDELFKEANEWLNSLPIGFIYNKNYNEDMVTLLIGELEQIANNNNAPKQYQVELNWLKSLRPQKQWKPSEEQMEALDRAQEELCSTEYNKPICDLIDSLSKLMEE